MLLKKQLLVRMAGAALLCSWWVKTKLIGRFYSLVSTLWTQKSPLFINRRQNKQPCACTRVLHFFFLFIFISRKHEKIRITAAKHYPQILPTFAGFPKALTILLRTTRLRQKQTNTLPRFKGALLLQGPDSFSCHRELCQVHVFGLPVVVGELKHTVPLPLHSAHHRVRHVLLHFTCDSRKEIYF